MDLGLTGKVAIVTGGSRGIGKAIAGELAREGADVAVCGRTRETIGEAAEALAKDTGRRVIPIVADTTKWDSVTRMVETVVAQLGRVDVLVNNAATPGGLVSGPLADADEAALLAAGESEIELLEPLEATNGVGRFLAQRGEGLHHLCLETDVDWMLADLKGRGVELIDAVPRPGLAGRIAFLHPRACSSSWRRRRPPRPARRRPRSISSAW